MKQSPLETVRDRDTETERDRERQRETEREKPDLPSVVGSELTVLPPGRQVSHAGTERQTSLVSARHHGVELLDTDVATSPVGGSQLENRTR